MDKVLLDSALSNTLMGRAIAVICELGRDLNKKSAAAAGCRPLRTRRTYIYARFSRPLTFSADCEESLLRMHIHMYQVTSKPPRHGQSNHQRLPLKHPR